MSGVIVHEWLESAGGAENVVEAMRGAFPDADLWCLWDDSAGRFVDAHETLLARTPLRRSKALALPTMPLVWRSLPAIDAEWVLVSSHLFAHHARFRGSARHAPKYVYAHTPARYIWTPELDGRGDSAIARSASAILRPLDRRRAQEATAIAANSRFVAERIARTWERDAVVIYPPIDTKIFAQEPQLEAADQARLDQLPQEFLLAVSRWVPYKRLEAAIYAGAAADIPVVLAGRGPDEGRLRAIAADHPGRVSFVEQPSSPLLRALYRKASAVVFAPVEDFGIVPVEAMASGTPVIANAIGGASESVVAGVTGAHVEAWDSADQLRAAVETALSADPRACVARARKFDSATFAQHIRDFVQGAGRETNSLR